MSLQHRFVDDESLGEVLAAMNSLRVAPKRQIDRNFKYCKRAWGSLNRLLGNKELVLARLRSNLGTVSNRPGFTYWEIRKERPPELPIGAEEVNEYVAVMTFVGAPQTYAYPHHIWRAGQDEFILWPSDIMGERKPWWQFWR
jgi:hypothetical protein